VFSLNQFEPRFPVIAITYLKNIEENLSHAEKKAKAADNWGHLNVTPRSSNIKYGLL
jgi:hypothetical protein